MPAIRASEQAFLDEITQHVLDNISNEQFGVSELAAKSGMSRSNLLRKVKKLTDLSVSQFIRDVRLREAMKLLKEGSFSVSEVAYKVGFSSVSYFIKCFGDVYGYPPGEVGKGTDRDLEVEDNTEKEDVAKENEGGNSHKKRKPIIWSVFLLALFFVVYLIFIKDIFHISSQVFPSSRQSFENKSIAVLPFINDSNDSTNVYVINGLMEAILTNLQGIENLRVISRTSAEKYRNSKKSIPEISKELNANYFIEGSGQKIGDKILVHIQLIESSSDKHLWAEQFKRDTEDIFSLQLEIAKKITDKIQVIVTPEEESRMKKLPTKNLAAYDYFLQGLNLLQNPDDNNLAASIPFFKQAIREDNAYARAYAGIAMAYYLLDRYRTEKQFADSINYYADKALFYDAELPQSLIAKGLYYMGNAEFDLAVSYFEKTLDVSPNNDLAYLFLIELYANHFPNTEKYLKYALKGQQLDIEAYDSITTSYGLLHLSNAFIQSGFIDEAAFYIDKSLSYFPGNLYSQYVKAYIEYAQNENLHQLKDKLLLTLSKDSNRLDILQEVGKAYYYLGEYEQSLKYYEKFTRLKELYQLEIFRTENAKVALVYDKMGRREKADKYFKEYLAFVEKDQSIYKHFSMSAYYSYTGEIDLAFEQLKLFSQEANYHYWTILFSPIDPLLKNAFENPEYKRVFKEIEQNFWKYHKQLRTSLDKQGLL